MFESDSEAATALVSAVESDSSPSTEQAAPGYSTNDDGYGAAPEDTFTRIDPSHLPEDIQAAYRQMQGDYTRKTQEAATVRSLLKDSGLDVEQARQALGFVQALQDPYQQQALYHRLAEQFGQTAEPEYESEEDSYERSLNTLQQRIDRMEQNALRTEVGAQIDRQEAILRTQNPSWSDDDLESVAQLAIARSGDLIKASEDYKSLQNRILSAHLQTKAQVPSGVVGLGSTGHAESPRKFDNLDDAHAAALRLLVNDLS